MAGLALEEELGWLPPPPVPRAAAGEQMIDYSDDAIEQEMPSVSEVSGVTVCTMGMEGCGALVQLAMVTTMTMFMISWLLFYPLGLNIMYSVRARHVARRMGFF